jgi:hypothetical protein
MRQTASCDFERRFIPPRVTRLSILASRTLTQNALIGAIWQAPRSHSGACLPSTQAPPVPDMDVAQIPISPQALGHEPPRCRVEVRASERWLSPGEGRRGHRRLSIPRFPTRAAPGGNPAPSRAHRLATCPFARRRGDARPSRRRRTPGRYRVLRTASLPADSVPSTPPPITRAGHR